MGSCSCGVSPPWVAMLAPCLPWHEGGKQEELWKGQLRPSKKGRTTGFHRNMAWKRQTPLPFAIFFYHIPLSEGCGDLVGKCCCCTTQANGKDTGLLVFSIHLSCECTAGIQILQQQILISVLASQLMSSPFFPSLWILIALRGKAVEGPMPPRRSCGGFISLVPSHILVFGKKKLRFFFLTFVC